MKKTFRRACRILCLMLMVCTVLTAVPLTARAEGDPYISRVDFSSNVPDYKAGDTPRATATVESGDCHVAYECWRELYKKEEGGPWYTRAYWYSDPDKMAALSDDKKFTQFEAGKEYSLDVILEADLGHIFSSLDTLEVYANGSEFSFTRINLRQQDMGMTTIAYSVNSLRLPAEDSVITDVILSGVNKSLDAASPVQFTAQVADADQMAIAEESWEKSTYGEDPPVDDIIKSTDAEADRYPIEGGEYWYSVTLTAKDGYIFSDTFNNSDYEGNVSFVVDGVNYSGCTYVKDNGKTLVAWEFLSPVTAIDSTPSVTKIGDVDIEGVKFDYAPGDAPTASARKCDPYDEYYDVEYEYWEQMEETSPGMMEPVAFWYSDPAKNAALPESKRITSFEEGKTYMYSVSLVARDNCEFSEITEADAEFITNAYNSWYEDTGDEYLRQEKESIAELLENFDYLKLMGAKLTVDKNLAAFTIGERLNPDTAVIHIEKANVDYKGAYTVINQHFARDFLSCFKYINREEDMGLEGLRKAKQSYCPDLMIKKYKGVLK